MLNRNEAALLVRFVYSLFPSPKRTEEELSDMISAWELALRPYEYKGLQEAALILARRKTDNFFPAVGEIIAEYERARGGGMVQGEAWGRYVLPALKNSAYNSHEEYAKLPPAVQIALGSADTLRAWSQLDESQLSMCEASFNKSYGQAAEKARTDFLVSGEYKALPAAETREQLSISMPEDEQAEVDEAKVKAADEREERIKGLFKD